MAEALSRGVVELYSCFSLGLPVVATNSKELYVTDSKELTDEQLILFLKTGKGFHLEGDKMVLDTSTS